MIPFLNLKINIFLNTKVNQPLHGGWLYLFRNHIFNFLLFVNLIASSSLSLVKPFPNKFKPFHLAGSFAPESLAANPIPQILSYPLNNNY